MQMYTRTGCGIYSSGAYQTYGPPTMGYEDASSAMESATSMFALDTMIQPHTADTGPPFTYAIGMEPASRLQSMLSMKF